MKLLIRNNELMNELGALNKDAAIKLFTVLWYYSCCFLIVALPLQLPIALRSAKSEQISQVINIPSIQVIVI